MQVTDSRGERKYYNLFYSVSPFDAKDNIPFFEQKVKQFICMLLKHLKSLNWSLFQEVRASVNHNFAKQLKLIFIYTNLFHLYI